MPLPFEPYQPLASMLSSAGSESTRSAVSNEESASTAAAAAPQQPVVDMGQFRQRLAKFDREADSMQAQIDAFKRRFNL